MKGKYSIFFGGAAREVGRSSFVLDIGDKFLLDHGLKLKGDVTEYPAAVKTNLNALILSHSHLDHSGHVPHLYDTSHCVSYMTYPTLEISRVLWFDTLKIAEMEGQQPLFSKNEIEKATKFAFPVQYNKKLQITEKTTMELFQAGHIPGAAITKFEFDNKSFVYTGDFKLSETPMFFGADLKSVKNCNYMVMESTYGDREHPPRKQVEKEFVEYIQQTVDRGGTALVASFAIARSQEVLEILVRNGFSGDIFYDGMGQKVARIFLENPTYLKDPKYFAKVMKQVKGIRHRNDRKKVFKQPSVIVTSAGMLQGGPAMFYLPHLIRDKRSSISLTGFQVDGTPGRVLLDTGILPFEGTNIKSECSVKRFDLSAHPPQSELLKAAEKLNPEKIFCVHGDTKVIDILIKELKARGFDASGPSVGDRVEF
ncbi:MAG: MBL fold metallo-hydrolase [Candidatus Diapherotrites archaeon]|nr:MBL fold metallo-hydrolase [Candidatus Diapherotrites archaeon]